MLLTLSLFSCDVLDFLTENENGAKSETEGCDITDKTEEENTETEDATPGKEEDGEDDVVIELDPPTTLEEINEYREAVRAAELNEFSDKFSDEAIDVLCEIYKLYDENLYIWLANLYESDIDNATYTVLGEPVRVGGFYYSNSARDNNGYLFWRFLPDIESTVQALNILENSGLAFDYGGKWQNMLSDDIKQELLNFALSLQSYKDGNFYHPQWGTNISSSRRGRDRGWAVQLIRALGEKPLFDTPSGVDGHYPIGTNPVASMNMPFGTSVAVAVSKVTPTAVATEFSSEENFKKYLDNLKINKDSYSAGNTLDSRSGEINAAGLTKYLREYLRDIQCDNGLWEEEVSYNAINGLMKLSSRFATRDPFPNADKAVNSIMSVFESEVENGLDETLPQIETICYIYNPWVALKNVMQYLSYEDKLALKSKLSENGSIYLQNTLDKLTVFKKDDGGFSYYQQTSSPLSQSAMVAVPGSRESDVNATGIAISTVFKYILPVYGIALGTAPHLYTKYDAQYFLSILEGVEYYPKE